MKELHLIASGIVQGVGFRAAVRQLALALKLTGTVRNLPDGNVEIIAQGTKENLESLISQLKQIHLHSSAKVFELKIEYYSVKNSFNTFLILK